MKWLTFTVSKELAAKATERARALRISRATYLRRLVERDVREVDARKRRAAA